MINPCNFDFLVSHGRHPILLLGNTWGKNLENPVQNDQGGEGSVAHWVEGEMNFFNLRKKKKRVRVGTVRDRLIMGGSVISRSFRKTHPVTLL